MDYLWQWRTPSGPALRLSGAKQVRLTRLCKRCLRDVVPSERSSGWDNCLELKKSITNNVEVACVEIKLNQ